jgi:hypothetical protein
VIKNNIHKNGDSFDCVVRLAVSMTLTPCAAKEISIFRKQIPDESSGGCETVFKKMKELAR